MNNLNGKRAYIVTAVTVVYALVVVGWQAGNWEQAIQIMTPLLGVSALCRDISQSEKSIVSLPKQNDNNVQDISGQF